MRLSVHCHKLESALRTGEHAQIERWTDEASASFDNTLRALDEALARMNEKADEHA